MSEDGGSSLIRRALEESGGVLDDATVLAVIAATVAQAKRMAYSRAEAAKALGVSTEFFDEHIAGEVHRVRRGRRTLYPFGGLLWWLWLNSDRRGHDQVRDFHAGWLVPLCVLADMFLSGFFG